MTRPVVLLFVASLCAATACRQGDAPGPVTAAPNGSAPPATSETRLTACAMLSAAEMSAIVATEMKAEAEEGNGKTTCRYRPGPDRSPSVEIEVTWGDGEVAVMSTGILGRLEPGIADSLRGIGDQAMAIGPRLMVRTGEDLVTLTLWGVGDSTAKAKRIIEAMRPRMGPSSQPRADNQPGAGGSSNTASTAGQSSEVAEAMKLAGQLMGGLISGSSNPAPQQTAGGGAASDPRSDASAAAGGSPPSDEPAFERASGTAPRVPLVTGLTIVTARHEPGRGDYEPMITIGETSPEAVTTNYSAISPEGERLSISRVVRREDLRTARRYRAWFQHGDPETFEGATHFSLSMSAMRELREQGQTDVVMVSAHGNPLADLLAGALGGDLGAKSEQPGRLKRLEPHAVAIPVLLNERVVALPAIHARGVFGGDASDWYILDDPENPLVLRAAGRNIARVVRIAFPSASEPPLEERLKTDVRVELHGIYFDVGKATLRPESEPVLRDIAAALVKHRDWKIGIEGHTDNVGGDADNLNLSRRRADAVKQALIERYHIAAASLATSGYGASRPKAANTSLAGRAQNRRVELVRQ